MENEILQQIREEMERSYRPRQAGENTEIVVTGEPSLESAGVRAALATLKGSYALVGQMPPEPPTWRGRLGAQVVKLVQRLLFWYTPQIVHFQYSALRAAEEQAKALETAGQRLRELQRRQDETGETVESLKSYIRQLQSELPSSSAPPDRRRRKKNAWRRCVRTWTASRKKRQRGWPSIVRNWISGMRKQNRVWPVRHRRHRLLCSVWNARSCV